MKTVLKRIANWWNQNATKRWLLTLDRLCVCWLFHLTFESFIETGGMEGVDLEVGVLFLAALILFITLYTPAYMFPAADDEVNPVSWKSPRSLGKRKEP